MSDVKNKRLLISAAAAIVLIAVAALLILNIVNKNQMRLVLQNGDTGKEYYSCKAYEGMEFGISFIHSVNKSEVYEIYEIRNGEIVLTKCIYSSFGAGVATEVTENQTLEYTDDGQMIISNINTIIPELSYIVGTVSDHLLRIEGKEISLRDLCGQNAVVQFLIK